MNENMNAWGILRKLSWEDVLLILGVLVLARLVVAIIRWAIRHLAEKAPARLRLFILRLLPISRLLIKIGAVVAIVASALGQPGAFDAGLAQGDHVGALEGRRFLSTQQIIRI